MLARQQLRSLGILCGLAVWIAAIGCSSSVPQGSDGTQPTDAKTTKGTPQVGKDVKDKKDKKDDQGKPSDANPKVTLNQDAGMLTGVVRWTGDPDPKAEL